MITWLDEEHRHSKAELIQMQQRVASQEGEQQDQARLVKDLEGRMAGMQAQMLRFNQLQTALQQLKDEVVQLLAQADERRQQEVRESERLRGIERDNTSRALNEIRRDLPRLGRLEEELGLRKAEQQRMGESLLGMQQDLNALGQEVENKIRNVPFLEDGRQQDAKRIARLQQESLEALKRLEQHGSRLQMIEDVMQRQERDTGELKELVSQLRTSLRESVEKQLLEFEQLKRQAGEWFETLEVHSKAMDGFTARMREFDDTYREDRQVVENVERFQEQIRREQAQVGELQRLAEERQRRQLEQWQEENEKRWRKELLHWEHSWAEQTKRNQQISSTFAEVEKRLAYHQAQIEAEWKFLESQITYQTQETRRWQGEMTRLLEERPKKE
jgi:hypothetical protein